MSRFFRTRKFSHRAAALFSLLFLASLSCQLLPAASTQTPLTQEPTEAPLQTVLPIETSPAIQTEAPVDTLPPVQTSPPLQTQPPAVQTQPPIQTVPPPLDAAFTLTRLTAIVKAGINTPLPRIENNQPVPFPEGSIVTVNTDGEALLQGELEGNQCQIFIFFDTRLQKKSCPRSTFTGSNVSCVQDGSAVFDRCSNMLVQTPTAEFQLTGTWVEVTYRRDLQTSVLLVSDGQVESYPITDADSYRRGDAVTVGAGEFLYTAPDDMLSQIEVPGVEWRQAKDWDDDDDMEALIQTYNLQRWYERGRQHAAESNVPFPNMSQTAGQPDLVGFLNSRDLTDADQRIMRSNPDFIGIPVRAAVYNQGNEPAGLFKISIEGAASDGTFVRPFMVPGQPDGFYPSTLEPLEAENSTVFDGLVFFPTSLAGETVTLVATVDSCAGEEFTPDVCYVDESEEGNNQSEPLTTILYP